MKYLFLLPLLLLVACNSKTLNTGQDFTVELVGTDSAFCWLSTSGHRYELYAPNTTFIERTTDDLKVDCDDNNSERRRVVTIEPKWDGLYYRYPETITIDFSNLDNGSRYNGYRADISVAPVSEILTEDSFSSPVEAEQIYPVQKDYVMGRRSNPVYTGY